jgi:hypothetical protein
MLKFSFDELVQIEKTLDKVFYSVSPLVDKTTSQDISLALYIIREVRHCAQTLEMPDELTRPESLKSKAVDRLVDMMFQSKKVTA